MKSRPSMWHLEVWNGYAFYAMPIFANNRKAGRALLREWSKRNPECQFRLVRYIRAQQ